ncbi:sensor histidine kinase [Okibacterium endophyticum]
MRDAARKPATSGPKLEFEKHLAEFVEHAQDLMSSQSRLRDLLGISHDLTSDLDIDSVLQRIVDVGTDLLRARFGALGIVGDENEFAEIFHVGLEPDVAAAITRSPEAMRQLTSLINDPAPVRSGDVGSRVASLPEPLASMSTFLGVPIIVREQIIGKLYLAESTQGRFSADDEELAHALADIAGIAITNARLFEESRYREKVASALADASRVLMGHHDDESHRDLLVDQVRSITESDLVTISRLSDDRQELVVDRASGIGADELEGRSLPVKGTMVGDAITRGESLIVNSFDAYTPQFEKQGLLTHAMAVPFSIGDSPAGVLALARTHDHKGFDKRDLDMGTSFAGHVSVVLERVETASARQRVTLLEDRSRIARDLHDHVIQHLFATGLTLQSIAASSDSPEVSSRIMAQIAELDGAIAQIRQSIFAMRSPHETTANSGVRARVLEIADRVSDQLHSRPRISFVGPVDLMADAALTDDVCAVVNEALANVVKHASASVVVVSVSATSGRLTVEVDDDGTGPGDSPRLSGLGNLRARAEGRDGTFGLAARDGGGTHLEWSVPV